MNLFVKSTVVLVALAIVGIAANATPSSASSNNRIRFETCNALSSSGKLNWHGIANGSIDDPFARKGSSRPFHAKACFATKNACDTWVKRIWWEIPHMDDLRVAYCKRV